MINKAGQDLITSSESIRLKAYFCPAGVPTIGRGHTKGVTAKMVKDGYSITSEEEAALFRSDMEEWERDVRACLVRQPNENQLAALVCLAFNIGMTHFKKSSVLKAYERGDDVAAAKAFSLWVKITDPVTKLKVNSNGLVLRRSKEASLYLTPVADEAAVVILPQAVEPPKTMGESTINRAGVIAGASTLIATLTDTFSSVTRLKGSVEGLGAWLMPVLLGTALVAIGYIIWERVNQRHQGLA